jgi:hypothetical protein
MLRGKAERAPYIRPLGRKALSVLQARPETMRVALHPSVFLLQSQFPVVMIWQNNRSADGRAIRRWSAEAALIARPFLEVIVCRLPPGGYAFIAALSVGQSVAAAEAAVAAVAADFNVASMLTLLADVQVVAGLRELNLRGARSA